MLYRAGFGVYNACRRQGDAGKRDFFLLLSDKVSDRSDDGRAVSGGDETSFVEAAFFIDEAEFDCRSADIEATVHHYSSHPFYERKLTYTNIIHGFDNFYVKGPYTVLINVVF